MLQPLFFRSQCYVEALRQDVAHLLSQFATDWPQVPPSDKDDASPFTEFKRLWTSTGWRHIHLAVVEPELRPHWWDAVVRAFSGEPVQQRPSLCLLADADLAPSERLRPGSEPDLQQLAAFYALYTLYFTQPKLLDSPKLPIKLTSATVAHLLSLPNATPSSPEDTQYLLTRFLSEDRDDAVLLYILPDELRDDPVLPTNKVSSQQAEEAQREMGKLAVAVQQQLQDLAQMPSSELHRPQPQAWLTEYLASQHDYIEARRPLLAQAHQQQQEQPQQAEGLHRFVDLGQQRLASDHPGLIRSSAPYVGAFGSQAQQLVQSFTEDLQSLAAIPQGHTARPH